MNAIRLNHILIFIVIFCKSAFAQTYQNVNFSIDELAKKIKFSYTPVLSQLVNSDSIKAVAYLVEIAQEDPEVHEIALHKTGREWNGEISFTEKNVAVMVILTDKSENIDNNNDKGYWTSIYENGKIKPGAFASIAYLYASGWSPELFHLARQRIIAHELFETEFRANPALKRDYYRWYLGTFDNTKNSEKTKFKLELFVYGNFDDLTEWELLDISKYYSSIGDNAKADKFNDLIFSRYPTGSWSTQMATKKLQQEFAVTDKMTEKIGVYGKFKLQTKTATGEDARRYVELIKGITMLSKLAPYYHESDAMDLWLKEVNELSNEFKFPTLIFGAKSLNDNGQPAIAEQLAKKTVDWMKNYLDTTYRNSTERTFYTSGQIRLFREKRYADFLDIYAQSLLLQNKLNEAIPILKDASITYAKRADVNINQHYIELLKKAGQFNEAILIIKDFARIGKSNTVIEEIYKSLTGEEKLPDNLSRQRVDALKMSIQKELINEKVPNFSLLDRNGEKASLDKYQNKVIIIDFWATWCAPCIAGFEAMQKLVEQYQLDKEVVFLFVNTLERDNEAKQLAKELFEKKKYPFILLFDDRNQSIVQSGVSALPTKILIDKSGRLRFRNTGLKGNTDEQVAELSAMVEMIR